MDTPPDAPQRMNKDLEVSLYRVAQEAVNNCVKHAHASRVLIELLYETEGVRLLVTDDGRGLPILAPASKRPRGLGLIGLRERLRPWGGDVRLGPSEHGGTEVTVTVRSAA